jgi:hypothetical protein
MEFLLAKLPEQRAIAQGVVALLLSFPKATTPAPS